MLRQFNSLSKFTATSIKCVANNTAAFVGLSPKEDQLPSPQAVAHWISETQRGLEAFLNDDFQVAHNLFTKHSHDSPFHAIGYALMTYVEAILEFEPEKIQLAMDRITAAEALAKQFMRKASVRKRHKPRDNECDLNSSDNTYSSELHYELLATNCMLMSTTIQFTRSNWLDYMKAAYRLKKAYRYYEYIFETLTGKKILEYAACINQENLSLDTKKKKKDAHLVIEGFVESGIFFGIGLFHLVFSLLPPKANKILNTLGFQASRPFALYVLQKSYKKSGFYSSLSALSLLAYYTNLPPFIHPNLLPESCCLEDIQHMMDKMNRLFSRGKIWWLLKGKLCKMEGEIQAGTQVLRFTRENFSGIQNSNYELAQLQGLFDYEMGWGAIFLGNYYLAAELFFGLEGINIWSKTFYRYIALCCMIGNKRYNMVAEGFIEIFKYLKHKRRIWTRLLPDELFVEKKIRQWKRKVDAHKPLDDIILNRTNLKKVMTVNPLWELIYLWNGFFQLKKEVLQNIKTSIESTLKTLKPQDPEVSLLYLLLGTNVRELGDYDMAGVYLGIALKSDSGDRWVLPYVYYELAVLCCFRFQSQRHENLLKEAESYIRKCEKQLNSQNDVDPEGNGSSVWELRLHFRCRLLTEKLDDFKIL